MLIRSATWVRWIKWWIRKFLDGFLGSRAHLDTVHKDPNTLEDTTPLHVTIPLFCKYVKEDLRPQEREEFCEAAGKAAIEGQSFEDVTRLTTGYAVDRSGVPNMWTVFDLNPVSNGYFVTYKLASGRGEELPLIAMHNVDASHRHDQNVLLYLSKYPRVLKGWDVVPYFVELMHLVSCVKGAVMWVYRRDPFRTLISNVLDRYYDGPLVGGLDADEYPCPVYDIDKLSTLYKYVKAVMIKNDVPGHRTISMVRVGHCYENFVARVGASLLTEEQLGVKRRSIRFRKPY